ncbi:MAG: hypothetical protein OWU33_08995 [Firmicutes bacterium]|nr:hypothetical protein [Bacillota bacterium]
MIDPRFAWIRQTFLGVPRLTWIGALATVTGGFLIFMLMFHASYGAATPFPFMLMIGFLLLALVTYRLSRAMAILRTANRRE